MRAIILEKIYSAIGEINLMRPPSDQLECAEETPLTGASSRLDSLALVNLIVTIEENLETELGKVVNIADQNAMSQETNPFQSVGTLADYISLLLDPATHVG